MIPSPAIAEALRHGPWLLLASTALMALLFAHLEIQIEGPHGWAARLPTWRLPKQSHWRWLLGGREITGYHLFAFAFVAAAFHWPLAVLGDFSLALEARLLACLAVFWILEDFLWFVLNPAFGLAKFRPRHVPWHPLWILGVPVDYLAMSVLAIVLFAFSYHPSPPPA